MILGFGENSIDTVHRVTTLPARGGKAQIQSTIVLPGGQVATTMAGCAALGMPARYVGAFGNDDGAAIVRAALAGLGVALEHAFVREAPNRQAVILVEEGSGERVVLWHRDPRLAIRPDEMRAEWFAGVTAVHVDAVDEAAAIAVARHARAIGTIVTCDIDHGSAATPDLLAAVTVPVLAAGVAAALAGDSDGERALRRIRQPHHTCVVMTCGDRGAVMLDGDQLVEEPAVAVKAVDTTGAGDIFRSGLIVGLLKGWRGRQLLRFANAAAAVSCTREGAIGGAPTMAETLAAAGDRG